MLAIYSVLMASPLAVRPVRARDREAILELWLALIDYHRALDPLYPVVSGIREALREEIERGLLGGLCRLLVAELDGALVGFAFAEVERLETREASGPGLCWIHELYVLPEERGRGVGSALVEAAEKFLEKRGGGRIAVRVESGNKDGLRFWERRSFVDRARILEKIQLP